MGLLDGLTEYWKLDEGSGSRAGSKGLYTLTEPDDPVGVATGLVYSNAADFGGDGVAPYEYLQSTTGAGGGDDFTLDEKKTIALWVWTDSYSVVFRVPIAKGSATTAEWRIYQSTNGFTGFLVNAASNNAVEVANPSTGAWHLFVMSFDPTVGASGTIYLQIDNGTPASQALGASLTTISSSYLRIGTNCVTASIGQEHIGTIGPVMIWSRLLTAGELTALYNGGAGLPFASFTTDEVAKIRIAPTGFA